MRQTIVFFSLAFVFFMSTGCVQCCKKPASAEETSVVAMNVAGNDASAIKAYYFHLARRCVTCQTVETVSENILKELYGNNVVLQSVNIEKKEGKELAKKLGVAGQSLIITNGTKTVNLINEGFMYARTHPDKLKEKIRETVESMK